MDFLEFWKVLGRVPWGVIAKSTANHFRRQGWVSQELGLRIIVTNWGGGC